MINDVKRGFRLSPIEKKKNPPIGRVILSINYLRRPPYL